MALLDIHCIVNSLIRHVCPICWWNTIPLHTHQIHIAQLPPKSPTTCSRLPSWLSQWSNERSNHGCHGFYYLRVRRLFSSVAVCYFVTKTQTLSRNFMGVMTRTGELSYRERLERLNLLPLVFDRELKDLVFFYKCLYGHTDLNIHNFVSFVTHGRTRQSNSFNLTTSFCKTSTFQASYFNRIVKLWNTISTSAPKTIFSTLNTFQNHVKETLSDLLKTYDVERPCTWSVVRSCACHRL